MACQRKWHLWHGGRYVDNKQALRKAAATRPRSLDVAAVEQSV